MRWYIMNGSIALPIEFSARVRDAVKLLGKQSFVRVISHYDADGITAAGVAISSLKRADIAFQTTITKSLDRQAVERISQENNDCTLFLDMGSGQIEGLEAMDGDVLVLDHHKPLRDSEKVMQVNPHFFGLDGMRDLSASSLTFIVCEAMSEENWASAPLAIAGVIGDMQHLDGYSSLNSAIVEGAIERGLVTKSNGLHLSGEKMLGMIADSVDPYFRGLSGHEEEVQKFLANGGFDASSRYRDMEEMDRRRLLSLLTLRLLTQGCSYETIRQISGDLLTISANGLRIDDFTQLLNACGRTDHPGVGLAFCLGDLNALQEATKYRGDYVRALLAALRNIEESEAKKMDNIQIIHPTNPALAGAICGISMQYLLDQDKPTLALSKSEGTLRVSARATRSLVEMGIDLSESLRLSSVPIGGSGGGHSVAAGATIPLAREEEFLRNVNEITGRQLKKNP